MDDNNQKMEEKLNKQKSEFEEEKKLIKKEMINKLNQKYNEIINKFFIDYKENNKGI